MTWRFGLTFILGTALLLLGGLFHANSAERYKEAWIGSWCKSPAIYQQIHDLVKQGDSPAAFRHYKRSVLLRQCVDLKAGFVSFKMSGVVKEYDIGPSGAETKTLVLEGNLVNRDGSLADKVYVWIGHENLSNFRKMAIPAPDGPQFEGWQMVKAPAREGQGV